MSSSLDRRVADALSLISHHVLRKGMEHPEGLSVTLPHYEGNIQKGELQVHVRVNLDEWPPEQYVNADTKIPISEQELMDKWGNDLDE